MVDPKQLVNPTKVLDKTQKAYETRKKNLEERKAREAAELAAQAGKGGTAGMSIIT